MALIETDLRAGTRQRILDATFRAVRDFGLSRTTVEDVAQRAALSRQTVYRYFPSKDHLILALVVQEEGKFIDGVRATFASRRSLERALEEATLFVLRYAHEHPLLDRLLATDPETLLPYLTTRGLPVVVQAREALVALVRERVLSAGEEHLRGILDGAVRSMLSYILTPSDREPAEIAADMAHAVVSSLSRPRKRAGP